MTRLIFIIVLIVSTFSNCTNPTKNPNSEEQNMIQVQHKPKVKKPEETFKIKFQENGKYISDGFDYPVNPPDAKNYYNAQPFGENNHLGDDWNGTGGENTDLGDPVYSISNGYVREAKDFGGGWGNVVQVVHRLENHPEYEFVESLYAHLDSMTVQEGDFVNKGQFIGTIGNCNGRYYAHLHFEMRWDLELPLGGGYSDRTEGYLDPTGFIEGNR